MTYEVNPFSVEGLYIRARIRRQAKDRKSVQEGQPDRLADQLEWAAREITRLTRERDDLHDEVIALQAEMDEAR